MRREIIDIMLELLDELNVTHSVISKEAVIKLGNDLNVKLTPNEIQEIYNLY